MHTHLMIINFLKVLRENSVFQYQSQGPQDPQDSLAAPAPKVLLVSIPFAKSGVRIASGGTLTLLEKYHPCYMEKIYLLAPKRNTDQNPV